MGLGPWSIVLIVIAALVVFGPKKLPELGKAFGHSLKEFKNATKGLTDDEEEDVKKPEEKES